MPKPKPKQKPKEPKNPYVRTGFMNEFRKAFIFNGTKLWPKKKTPEEVALDLRTFHAVMTDSAIRMVDPSLVSPAGLEPALYARLVTFLETFKNSSRAPKQGWPLLKNTDPAALNPTVKLKALRLWEALQAMQDLFEAVAFPDRDPDDGGGGDNPKWPPRANDTGDGSSGGG